MDGCDEVLGAVESDERWLMDLILILVLSRVAARVESVASASG
jgi:hypothetical protein